MCRSEPHGRRCPGDTGAKRRARQRAAYARKKQERLEAAARGHGAGADRPGGGPAAGGAPTPADVRNAAAQACASAFHNARWREYSHSVRKLGALVSTDADTTAAARMTDAGLDPASIEAWQQQEVAALERQSEDAAAAMKELIATRERYEQEKTEQAKADYDAASAVQRELSTALSERRRAGMERAAEMERQRAAIRRDAYLDALRASGVEFDGGRMPEPVNKMTRKDAAMMGDVIGNYPNGLVEHTEARSGASTWKRSKARAHYTSSAPIRKKVNISSIPQVRKSPDGSIDFDPRSHHIAPLDVPDGSLWGWRRSTLVDTPENREKLQAAVDAFNNDPDTNSSYYVRVKGGLVIDEFTDAESGEKRIVARYRAQRKEMHTVATAAELTFSNRSSMTNEYAHRVEAVNPEIARACKAFLYERTEDLPEEVYHKKEMCIPDGFADRYMGKDYPAGPHTEIFSTGMEALMCGRMGGLIGEKTITSPMILEAGLQGMPSPKADPEHRDLILGLLAMGKIPPPTNARDEEFT